MDILVAQVNSRDKDDFTPVHLLCDAADRGGGVRTLVLKMMLDTGICFFSAHYHLYQTGVFFFVCERHQPVRCASALGAVTSVYVCMSV